MPRDAKDVMASLEKKGFQRRDGDDIYYHLYVGGKKTPVFTKISQGAREIDDRLLSAMKRQLRLTRQQFTDLIDCPLTFQGLVDTLRAGNHIERT
jgi:hypothetical protein